MLREEIRWIIDSMKRSTGSSVQKQFEQMQNYENCFSAQQIGEACCQFRFHPTNITAKGVSSPHRLIVSPETLNTAPGTVTNGN